MASKANLNAYEAEARLGARWSCKDILELIEEVKASRIIITQQADTIAALREREEHPPVKIA